MSIRWTGLDRGLNFKIAKNRLQVKEMVHAYIWEKTRPTDNSFGTLFLSQSPQDLLFFSHIIFHTSTDLEPSEIWKEFPRHYSCSL